MSETSHGAHVANATHGSTSSSATGRHSNTADATPAGVAPGGNLTSTHDHHSIASNTHNGDPNHSSTNVSNIDNHTRGGDSKSSTTWDSAGEKKGEDAAMGDGQSLPDEPIHPVEDDDIWTEGDISIVSSDHVRFFVASYHICSASPVLRARLEEPPSNDDRLVVLDNNAYNTAATVRHFLHFVTKGDIDCVPPDDLYLLVHFLKVYECHVLLKLVLWIILEYHRTGKIEPITTFTLGAVASDKEALTQALEAYESKWPNEWGQNEDSQYTVGPARGSYVFDPLNWPLDLWDKVLPEVVHALMSAWDKRKACTGLSAEFRSQIKKVTDEAKRISNAAGERSSNANTTTPPPIIDDPHWTDGDFELISTNSIRFRANSFDLFAHSRVFRDGRALSNCNMSVAFTDTEIETSQTIQNFLELIQRGRVANVRYHPTSHTLVPLINFLIKYDCPIVLSGFLRYLRETIDDGTAPSSMTVFLVGVAADDPKTCASALKPRGSRFAGAGPLWNPRCWPFAYWTALPTPYFWALGRAWNKAGDTKRLPTEFRKWLDVARG